METADIGVALTAPGNAPAGQEFTIGIFLVNNGPDRAGIEMKLTVTGGTNVKKTVGCGGQPPIIRCNRGFFNPGVSQNFNMKFTADSGPVTFRLEYTTDIDVDPVPGNDVSVKTVIITITLRASGNHPVLGFNTLLSLNAPASGQIRINESSAAHVDAGVARTIRTKGQAGRNVIEAELPAAFRRTGFWRFDFAGFPEFVPGSLVVESGQVLSLDARSIVFAVRDDRPPPIQFRFDLRSVSERN